MVILCVMVWCFGPQALFFCKTSFKLMLSWFLMSVLFLTSVASSRCPSSVGLRLYNPPPPARGFRAFMLCSQQTPVLVLTWLFGPLPGLSLTWAFQVREKHFFTADAEVSKNAV